MRLSRLSEARHVLPPLSGNKKDGAFIPDILPCIIVKDIKMWG